MSTFRNHAGKRCRRRVSAEERRERVRYWIGMPAVTVGVFLAMCAAAGVL